MIRKYAMEKIPNSEIDRLANVLSGHLRKMGIKKSKEDRISLVKNIIEKQNYTCAFDNGHGCCWNHPKNKNIKYLKLEWGHKIPLSVGHTNNVDGLYLLCARCNNHIQSSRTVEEIKYELEQKLKMIERYINQ